MPNQFQSNRPLLQRRNSLINTFQAMADAAIIITVLVVASVNRDGAFSYIYLGFIILLLAVTAFSYDVHGVYRRHSSSTQKALSLFKAWSISFAVLLSFGYLLRVSSLLSREVLLQGFVIGYFFQLGSHILFRKYQKRSISSATTNCLIIGTGTLANYLYDRVNSNPWIAERAAGLIDIGDSEADNTEGGRVIGSISEILKIVEKLKIRSVYIAVPLESSPVIRKVYFQLLDCNVDVHWAPNIFDLPLINHSVKEFAGLPILTLSETPLIGTHIILKAIEDRVLSTIALIFAAPLLIATIIAIKVDSSGPVFFKQRRTGWDGEEFTIYKFRSMFVQGESSGALLKQAGKDDPRVTKVGRFIRKTSIDELPQLFNVLLGSMSMVGPRPHATEHNVEYSSQIIAYLGRHRIKPGITGLAQVRGFRGETKEIELMNQRVQHDLEYINNWSVVLDISILIKTVFALLRDEAY